MGDVEVAAIIDRLLELRPRAAPADRYPGEFTPRVAPKEAVTGLGPVVPVSRFLEEFVDLTNLHGASSPSVVIHRLRSYLFRGHLSGGRSLIASTTAGLICSTVLRSRSTNASMVCRAHSTSGSVTSFESASFS